jgi:Putative capsular polysaccharide synthesis protein
MQMNETEHQVAPMFPYYLIHQVGKVASQTLEAAIRRSTGGTSRIERHHYLSDDGLANLESMCRLPGIQADGFGSVMQQLTVARAVRDELDAYLEADVSCGVWVLTGVRHPLDLSVAAFFQNLRTYCPSLDYDDDNADCAADRLIEFFNSEFDRMLLGKSATSFPEALLDLSLRGPEPWFDKEFRPFYDVDVYERPIGRSQPFITFSSSKFNFVIYRTELLSTAIHPLLRTIGAPAVVGEMSSVNVGEEKDYLNLYRVFKRRFKPSVSVKDYYYGGPFFRHFYGERK